MPPRGGSQRSLTMQGAWEGSLHLMDEADKTFEDGTAAVTQAARSLIARLRSIDN
jgi:hypothetical protein